MKSLSRLLSRMTWQCFGVAFRLEEGNMIHQDVQKFQRSKVTQKSNLTLTFKLFTSNKFSGDDLDLPTNSTLRTAWKTHGPKKLSDVDIRPFWRPGKRPYKNSRLHNRWTLLRSRVGQVARSWITWMMCVFWLDVPRDPCRYVLRKGNAYDLGLLDVSTINPTRNRDNSGFLGGLLLAICWLSVRNVRYWLICFWQK